MVSDSIAEYAGSIRVALRFPVRDVREVQIRRPKVRDLRAMGGGGDAVQASVRLLSSLSGLTSDVVEELDAADFAAINEVVTNMMGEPRGSVTPSSPVG